MSKEMLVISLGVLLIVQTQFGIPDSWHTGVVVFSGIAIILLGFFLRTDALSRGHKRAEHQTFVENTAPGTADTHSYDRKERINSLN